MILDITTSTNILDQNSVSQTQIHYAFGHLMRETFMKVTLFTTKLHLTSTFADLKKGVSKNVSKK